MMFGYGWTSFAWIWAAGALALVGLVVGLVLLLLGRPPTDEAAAILAGRLARGEIDRDEYAQRLTVLGPAPRGRGPVRLGGTVLIVSLIALATLAGLTITGTMPRPGTALVEPGATGFEAGTVEAPRVVWIVAGPGPRFYPDVVRIAEGETVTFEVTTMGLATHEFMVGPAAPVAADTDGTPEIADIGMMQTKALTYTFNGSGPFAFACHAPGHYEAGMTGAIEVVR